MHINLLRVTVRNVVNEDGLNVEDRPTRHDVAAFYVRTLGSQEFLATRVVSS